MKKTNIEPNTWKDKYVLPFDKDLDFIYNSLKDEVVYNILIGSYRSAKTTTLITAFCMNLQLSNDRLHFTLAFDEANAKTILWDGDGLGIKYFPDWQRRIEYVNGKPVQMPQQIFEGKYKQRDALILHPLPYENKPVKYIVAYGGGKESSYKAFRGASVGSIIATEVNLFHPNTITEYTGRTGASNRLKIFEDGNPGNPNQWYKKERLDYLMEKRSHELNYGHRTLVDNPILTDLQIERLSNAYPKNSPQHRNLILGEWVGAEGLVYTLTNDNILKDFDPNDYMGYRVSADIGQTKSATTFIVQAVTKDRKYIDTLFEYYHRNDGKSNLGVKMPIDYANDYLEFIKQAMSVFNRAPLEILSDHDITFVREFNKQRFKYNLGGLHLNHNFGKEKIVDRIKQGLNLFHLGRKRIHKENCPNVWEAYETASYDSKEELKGNYVRYDNPQDNTKIDPIDADEYSMSRFRYELDRYKGG